MRTQDSCPLRPGGNQEANRKLHAAQTDTVKCEIKQCAHVAEKHTTPAWIFVENTIKAQSHIMKIDICHKRNVSVKLDNKQQVSTISHVLVMQQDAETSH